MWKNLSGYSYLDSPLTLSYTKSGLTLSEDPRPTHPGTVPGVFCGKIGRGTGYSQAQKASGTTGHRRGEALATLFSLWSGLRGEQMQRLRLWREGGSRPGVVQVTTGQEAREQVPRLGLGGSIL